MREAVAYVLSVLCVLSRLFFLMVLIPTPTLGTHTPSLVMPSGKKVLRCRGLEDRFYEIALQSSGSVLSHDFGHAIELERCA
jgi:hypothetical protein